jgi:hypothetical protein
LVLGPAPPFSFALGKKTKVAIVKLRILAIVLYENQFIDANNFLFSSLPFGIPYFGIYKKKFLLAVHRADGVIFFHSLLSFCYIYLLVPGSYY